MPQSSHETPEADPVGELDLLLYGLLGLALLGFITYEVGKAFWSTGSGPLFGGFVAFVVGTLVSVIRDAWRRQLSWASRGFLVAWGLCVAVITITELIS